MVMVGVAGFLHNQMHRVSLSLFFLSPLFQRTTIASKHFPQNNRALSPFRSQGATVQRTLRQ